MENDPNKKEMLELLVKSCSQWESIHHHILSALSMKQPQTIQKEQFSLNQEIIAIKDMLEATIRLKNLDISVETVPAQLDLIETDRLKFRLILSSLLGNAVNFTDEGSVKV